MKMLNEFAEEQELNNLEVIKWIVVKTLRLTISRFDDIKQISEDKIELMKEYIVRYRNGESLSKIFGYIEFYGNYFDVTENVFDPRLSSEALVDKILKFNKKFLENANIIDLCTGSGCIAITLSKLLNKNIDALDISPFAIEIAKNNAKKNDANVNFFKFDLNDDWEKVFIHNYDIIVSNPPYWDESKILYHKEVVRNNPLSGFDGGEDGLKYIRLIIKNAYKYLNKNGYLVLEVDFDQINVVKKIMIENGYHNINVFKDYKNIDRVVCCKKI